MFVTQLIFSYLLSAVGFVLYYFGIRKYSTALQRKFAIYAIVGLSIALPFYFIQSTPALFQTEISHDSIAFHDEPMTTQKLLQCYRQSKTQEGFCHCEETQQASIILYQQNPYYDIMLLVKEPLLWFFGGITFFLLLLLLSKIGYLQYLKRTTQHHVRWIDGKAYIFLVHSKKQAAASFRLRKSYIVWHKALDKLPTLEQEAIIQHEISHLNNKDTWEQITLHLIQFGWFFNPIYYAVKRELNLVNEYLADAFAVQKIGNPKTYAALLIQMKERQQFGLVSQFGQHPFKSRIKTLLCPPRQSKFKPLFLGLLLSMTIVSFSIAPLFNQQSLNFKEYCHLHDAYKTSGKKAHCKNCLFEDLNPIIVE